MKDIITSYISKADWRVNENSNMGYSLQGLNNYVTGELMKRYWLDEVYPENISLAHIQGDIQIHDISSGVCSYCGGWDLYDLLRRGFSGVEGKVHCTPPKHFKTCLGQIVNFFFTIQGEFAGAVAVSSFDTYLAPFVAYDRLSYDEVKQSIQEFIYNMNVPTRVGFQQVFSNLTFDLVCPSHLANTSVLIGGEMWGNNTYNQYQECMDMINKAFCEVMYTGDGLGAIFPFPIPTYNITTSFDWNSEVAQSIFKMTLKFGNGYFCNYLHTDLLPEQAVSMCCRLRLNLNDIRKGGVFCSNPLTGSIGVCTINLPAVAYRSRGKSKDEFFSDLKACADLGKQVLDIKRKRVEEWMELGLYPYSKVFLSAVKQQTGEYFSNHFSTIGVLGGHEACLNYLGVGIETDEGREFIQDVLVYLRGVLEGYQESGGLYNLEATPGEGASYRFALLDKKRYPLGNFSGSEASPYYTNSTQLPVNFSNSVGKALEHQAEVQPIYTGGTVHHVFLGESVDDENTVKRLVKNIAENYNLPYFSITPTFSLCAVHGYLQGEQEECPICKNKTQVYSRIVGYFRPVSGWNLGKKQEFKDRVVYTNLL